MYQEITFNQALINWDKSEYSMINYDHWRDFSRINLQKYKKSKYKKSKCKGKYQFRIKLDSTLT